MKTPAKKLAANAAYRARKRAAAKLAAPQPAGETLEELAALPGSLEIEVQEPGPATPKSFVERMTARFKAEPGEKKKPAAKRGAKKIEVNFLTKALPILSGVLASYAETFFAEEYRSCAPKREEITAIIAPIFAMIERRIQISGELSEDAMDWLAVGMALLGYAGRAYTSYIDQKRLKGKSNANSSQTAAESPDHGAAESGGQPADGNRDLTTGFGRSESTASSGGSDGDLIRVVAGNVDGFQASNDVEIGTSDDPAYAEHDRARQLEVVGRAFKLDARYRASNGLL